MMKHQNIFRLAFLTILSFQNASSFSMQMKLSPNIDSSNAILSRRDAFFRSVTAIGGAAVALPLAASAAPEIFTTPAGVKYAITGEPKKNMGVPREGDIVAIDYTGYLSNGQIFDATHSIGKKNALLFKLGSGSVIPGLDDIVDKMEVGQKVQAIIPPSLAYGDKGVCLDDGECLIKPGATLVYDVFLKKASIPPP